MPVAGAAWDCKMSPLVHFPAASAKRSIDSAAGIGQTMARIAPQARRRSGPAGGRGAIGRGANMTQPVLVTGANGHLGYNLVQALRQRGYAVRAGMRNAADPARSGPLRALGADVVEVELLDPATLKRALEGAQGLFQNAAVFRLTPGDHRDTLNTGVRGSENALHAARAAGVKRIVYISSCTAVGTSPQGRLLTEADWAERPALPYIQAKRDGERAALDFAAREGLVLISLLPGNLFGPGFQRHTPTTAVVGLLMDNRVPALPQIMMYPVDVRDVAEAAVRAYEREHAAGRYLLTAETFTARELAAQMRTLDSRIRVPLPLPRFLLPVVPAVDALAAKLLRLPHLVTRELLADMAGDTFLYDHSRARAELGWQPRPLEQTLRDTMDWIRSRKPSYAGV